MKKRADNRKNSGEDLDEASSGSDGDEGSDAEPDTTLEDEDAESNGDGEEEESDGEEYEVDPQREAADQREVDAIARAVDEDEKFKATADEVKFGRHTVTKVSNTLFKTFASLRHLDPPSFVTLQSEFFIRRRSATISRTFARVRRLSSRCPFVPSPRAGTPLRVQ